MHCCARNWFLLATRALNVDVVRNLMERREMFYKLTLVGEATKQQRCSNKPESAYWKGIHPLTRPFIPRLDAEEAENLRSFAQSWGCEKTFFSESLGETSLRNDVQNTLYWGCGKFFGIGIVMLHYCYKWIVRISIIKFDSFLFLLGIQIYTQN